MTTVATTFLPENGGSNNSSNDGSNGEISRKKEKHHDSGSNGKIRRKKSIKKKKRKNEKFTRPNKPLNKNLPRLRRTTQLQKKVQDHPLEKCKRTKPPTKNVLYSAVETYITSEERRRKITFRRNITRRKSNDDTYDGTYDDSCNDEKKKIIV
ncbi:hypothetical protein C2G38_2185468 [Gigaspora rosea]|uniref:Uncharacterized protein n=1 Tax=Gigaspora rosea TaxID=44941 RepID=A0A397V8A4_9GLOM|nr:hypothetical protein C2G38_2185468 [Gigaspora rosea]